MKDTFVFEGKEYKTKEVLSIADKWLNNFKSVDADNWQDFVKTEQKDRLKRQANDN